MNTAEAPREPKYRASQGSLIPPHIARTHWRQTGLVLGSVVGLGMLGLWVSQQPRIEHADPAGKVSPRERPAALIAESARLALPAAVDAVVPVQVHVEASGAVSETKIETPTPAMAALESRALAAARSYKYTAGLHEGAPADGWVTLQVRFAPMPSARRVTVKGSDTIGSALGQAWAGALEAQLPDVLVEVEALGSSTGFAGLFDGSAELAASSRPIRAEEEATAKKLGINLRHAVAGHDGIAVIVNDRSPLQSLDLTSVAKVFAGRITRWSELGTSDAELRVLGRPSYSGTNGFFRERVLGTLGDKLPFGPAVEPVESSATLVGRVVSDPNAIGYVSVSHVIPSVRALPLSAAPGGAAVAPSPASLRDGSYPISRPLLLYWREDASKDALAYVQLALSEAGQKLVDQAGFVPLAAGEANADAAAIAEQLAKPAAAEAEAHKPGAQHRVYFDQASVGIAGDAKNALGELAAQLKAGKHAVIVGNADASGRSTTNSLFAKRRADAVAAALRSLGVPAAQLTVQVANADHPLATNETEEGRRENRRVDILLTDH